jgi:hypothetical protein
MASSMLINTNAKSALVLTLPPPPHTTQCAYAHLSMTQMLENHDLLNYFWD